jgi:hypothetical protein
LVRWEYTRAEAVARGSSTDSGTVREKALTGWLARLNSLGEEGWELVSEERGSATYTLTSPDFMARYGGTFKRPRGQ